MRNYLYICGANKRRTSDILANSWRCTSSGVVALPPSSVRKTKGATPFSLRHNQKLIEVCEQS